LAPTRSCVYGVGPAWPGVFEPCRLHVRVFPRQSAAARRTASAQDAALTRSLPGAPRSRASPLSRRQGGAIACGEHASGGAIMSAAAVRCGVSHAIRIRGRGGGPGPPLSPPSGCRNEQELAPEGWRPWTHHRPGMPGTGRPGNQGIAGRSWFRLPFRRTGRTVSVNDDRHTPVPPRVARQPVSRRPRVGYIPPACGRFSRAEAHADLDVVRLFPASLPLVSSERRPATTGSPTGQKALCLPDNPVPAAYAGRVAKPTPSSATTG